MFSVEPKLNPNNEIERNKKLYRKFDAASSGGCNLLPLIGPDILQTAGRIFFGPIGVGMTFHGKALAFYDGNYMHVRCSNSGSRGLDSVELLLEMFRVATEKHLGAIFLMTYSCFTKLQLEV